MINKKILSLVIGTSMLLSYIPATSVMAAETKTPTKLTINRAYEGIGEAKVVNCYSLEVHKSTSVSSTTIGWLQKDQVVMVDHSYETDANPSWACVSYTNSSGQFIRGFVKNYYLKML
ncbi:hypothetical protein SAMN02745163_03045 [Clostridium cavendishii DSM 21758]|uniref:SH3 domain-containing protein n=1 Tax=Clostridium cavendishii DSM 21758 TaxID=1121302 RepID=A0A1M6P6D7_9CLOT|nr:hypothetical protein [Clostridium cavendishii]SHK03485.1 hypothetical protein SAMN02745163_03045 [Clostridium cavendishii DSM 21758]